MIILTGLLPFSARCHSSFTATRWPVTLSTPRLIILVIIIVITVILMLILILVIILIVII